MKVYVVEDICGELYLYDNIGDAMRKVKALILTRLADLNDLTACYEDIIGTYNDILDAFDENGFYVEGAPCLYIKDMELTKERRN